MTRERPLPPEVRALLDHEREIQPLPATVRARAVARARAALVAGVDRRVVPMPARRPRWLAAAAMICIIGAGVGAAAYQVRVHMASPPEIRPLPAPVKHVAPPPPARPAEPAVEVAPEPEAAPRVVKRALSKAESAREELHLLRQARAAVARDDFAAALPPIAEHAHRFKGGRLSEEREALRVKALAALGRTDEARRAAAAFRTRFPRSVLLSAVDKLSPPPGP